MSGEQIDSGQLKFWAKELGCSEQELGRAIDDVGNCLDAVERRLKDRVGRTAREIAFWSVVLVCTKKELEQSLDTYGSKDDADSGFPLNQVRVWLSRVREEQPILEERVQPPPKTTPNRSWDL